MLENNNGEAVRSQLIKKYIIQSNLKSIFNSSQRYKHSLVTALKQKESPGNAAI